MEYEYIIKNKQDNNIYEVIFDNGKPYTEHFKGEIELIKGLKEFYLDNRDNDDYFNFEVFLNKINISESQFIQEIIREILEDE